MRVSPPTQGAGSPSRSTALAPTSHNGPLLQKHHAALRGSGVSSSICAACTMPVIRYACTHSARACVPLHPSLPGALCLRAGFAVATPFLSLRGHTEGPSPHCASGGNAVDSVCRCPKLCLSVFSRMRAFLYIHLCVHPYTNTSQCTPPSSIVPFHAAHAQSEA